MDLASVFACRYPVFPATFVEEAVFSNVYFGNLVKIRWAYCMYSYMGLLFYSTGLHICFYVSTMLLLLLWLCSIDLWSFVFPNEFLG
jgi:hypothetical protein